MLFHHQVLYIMICILIVWCHQRNMSLCFLLSKKQQKLTCMTLIYLNLILHKTKRYVCKQYFVFNILSSLHQESDQILHALRPCSIYEVARFFSLYDLQVTERQKIQFLSLAAASGKNYLLDYELYSILIVCRLSISYWNESFETCCICYT